jgi:hypothetical protein
MVLSVLPSTSFRSLDFALDEETERGIREYVFIALHFFESIIKIRILIQNQATQLYVKETATYEAGFRSTDLLHTEQS